MSAALLVLLLSATSEPAEIACHGAVLRQSWALLESAMHGYTDSERAAFIVRDSQGDYVFVTWPFKRRFQRSQYIGTIPTGTVAIIHTHPNHLPLPSIDDQETAERLGLPVYAVTIRMMARTDGRRPAVLWTGVWNPDKMPSGCATHSAR